VQTGYFDEKTEAQLKNTLGDQLKKIRERIIRPAKHGSAKRKEIGELSSQGPDANRKRQKAWAEENPEYQHEHYEDNKDEIKKKREENKDEIKEYMAKWYEENKDEVKKKQKAYRELAAVRNAEQNAELTDLMHAGSDGAEFRPFTAPEVVHRKKQILEKKRAIFDGMSLAEAIKGKEFALYFFSTRTRVVESDMKNDIPTAPGGYGEAGRFLSARGSMQKVRVTLRLSPLPSLTLFSLSTSSHELPCPRPRAAALSPLSLLLCS